jgi:hypothetical protein
MSYEKALEAAGAKVLAFEQFGSYQGDWWALVETDDHIGWVHDYFGSCSHCDAFESDFGYGAVFEVGEHMWDRNGSRVATEADVAPWREKLRAFGAAYLENILTQQEAEKLAAENIEWDGNAAEMLAFIKQHAPEAAPEGE